MAHSIAIEYERSLKMIARYREIREILNQDQTVGDDSIPCGQQPTSLRAGMRTEHGA